MSTHEKFNYQSLAEVNADIQQHNLKIILDEDFTVLKEGIKIGSKIAPNKMAILPMEGCDSLEDGSPSELVIRRYKRFSSGGAGLIWWEANAVCTEGKANPLQMMLTKTNSSSFENLLIECDALAQEKNGFKPLHILQLTHSGRYSRPLGHKAMPLVPQRDPILDPRVGITSDDAIVTDEYLESLIPLYVESALLAKKVGFDGVDIKACHRYLISELLASHTREGKYGGSFENRTRLLLDIVRAVRQAVGPEFIIACRFNVFDAHPYPYGFGCDKEDMWQFDSSEPIKLTKALCEASVDLISNSAGNPYYIYPQVTRPFDVSSQGIPVPDEHPLESVARLFEFTEVIQEAAGDVPVIGNGYTWLREYSHLAGASNIKQNRCKMMGFGRMAFAYPEIFIDIIKSDNVNGKKACITCSKCTQIMRDHGRTGCVIKDSQIYAPLYKTARADAENRAL